MGQTEVRVTPAASDRGDLLERTLAGAVKQPQMVTTAGRPIAKARW